MKEKAPQKRHVPNDHSRTIIFNMCAYGFTIEQMVAMTGIAGKQLYAHYGTELKTARMGKDLDVLDSAYLQAVGGPNKDWEKAKFPATKAYLEKRGLWRQDAPTTALVQPDLSRLTDDQLEQYYGLLNATDPRRLGGPEEGSGGGTPEEED